MPSTSWTSTGPKAGDDQVGVQQRVAFSGRPVVEPDRQQAPSGHILDTAMAAAGAQVLV